MNLRVHCARLFVLTIIGIIYTTPRHVQCPLFFGLTRQARHTLVNASGELPALMQDLATFLLVRGRYAWIGHD